MESRPGSDPADPAAPADGAAPVAALPKTQAEAVELQRRAEEDRQHKQIAVDNAAYATMEKFKWHNINMTAAEQAAAAAARQAFMSGGTGGDVEPRSPTGIYRLNDSSFKHHTLDKLVNTGCCDISWSAESGSLDLLRKPPTANDLINGMEFMVSQGCGKIKLDWDSASNVTELDAKNIGKLLTAAMAKVPPVAIEFGPELKQALAGNKQLMDLQAESVKRYNEHWQSKNIDDVKQDLTEQHGVDVSDRGLARALEGLGPDENAIDAALPPEAQEAVAGARDYIGTEIADEGVKGELNRIVNEFATNVADPDKADTAIMDLQNELSSAAKNKFITEAQETAIVGKALQAYDAVNDQNAAPSPPSHGGPAI